MKIVCSKCGKETNRNTGDYWYIESGLDNVFLRNILINECSCGLTLPSLFKLSDLNNLIADAIVKKAYLLKGKEIRFLRKSLRFSAIQFSEYIGIDNTTLSKWENGIQEHSEQNDRLIRSLYLILKGVESSHAQRIIRDLSLDRLSRYSEERILFVELFGDEYKYRWQIPTPTTRRVILLIKKPFVGEPISPAGALITLSSSSFGTINSKFEITIN